MADQVAVLRGGRLVQLTDPQTLYRRPADLDVATFVGESVVLEADVRDGRAHSLLGELALDGAAPDGPARVLLRPEQLRLGAPSAAVRATVRSIDFYGHDSRVWLDLPGGASVIARTEGADLPAVGQDVGITVVGAGLPFPAEPGASLPRAVALEAGAEVSAPV
jgi:iron(III) transport system ATP-binding protein